MLFTDQTTEELGLETRLRYSEINNGGLGGEFGGEVRVCETRGEEQAEFIIEVHLGVCNVHYLVATLLNVLFLENGVKHGVNLVFNVLNHAWRSILERNLQLVLQVLCLEGVNEVTLHELILSLLDPGDGLALRINHEGVTSRTGNHNTVLGRKFIRRKTFQIPLANSGGVNQEFSKEEVVSARNATSLQIFLEFLNGQLHSELVVEGTAIGDESASFGYITNQLGLCFHELLAVLNPTDLVLLERSNQTIGLVHLLASLSCLIGQLLLLGNFRVEFSLEFCLQLVDSVEFFLGSLQLGTRLLKRNGLLVQKNKLGLHNLGLLVIVAHSGGPSAETPERSRGGLGNFGVEKEFTILRLEGEIGLKQLNGLFVDQILLVL